MTDTVIFDLGKVLVDFHPEFGMRQLGFSKEAVEAFMNNIFPTVWETVDARPYSDEEVRRLFKEYVAGFEREVDLLWSGDNAQKLTGVYDYSENWIKSLKDKGYKVYVLSNFGQRFFEINSKMYHFLDYIDGKVISYEVSMVKPDLGIYKCLADKYSIIPQNAVFIDDRKANIDAAVEFGFKGIVFESYAQANEELEKILHV